MTHPIDGAIETQPKAESFVDWFHINSRWITIGAVVVGLGVFGYWFVERTALNETINSDKQLQVAKQSLNSGNIPLAEADLKKVADKYANKPAGAEAGMLLAQTRMDRGDYQGALTILVDLSNKVTSGPNAASVHGLRADALSQLERYADAAANYEKAAGLTTMANEKGFWLTKAARAHMLNNKPAEARKILEGLAAQTENEALSTEARVRLGELSVGAKP
jgi:predicted negative regulator of RcsB-dependent stress response